MRNHPVLAGVLAGIVGTILVGIAVWLTVVYGGLYNVAASDPHADVVRWSFDTTMHQSVANRAGDVDLPERPSAELIAAGAGHYTESCVHCHGAPGREPAEWSRGMRPEPPHLTEAAAAWTAGEIHWIVSNGIKMTGMPAFGGHHSAQEITAIAAFVSMLPGLTVEDYEALAGSGRGDTGHSHSSAGASGNGDPASGTDASGGQ